MSNEPQKAADRQPRVAVPVAVFTYYRVRLADEAGVREQVTAFQEALRRRHPGLQATLMRRLPAGPDLVTMMETYTPAPPRADDPAPLIEEIEQQAARVLAPWLASPRQVEVFAPCA